MAKLSAELTLNTSGFQSALKGAKASMGGTMMSMAKGTAVVAAAVAAAGAAIGALTYKLILSGEAANSADARVRNIAKSMGLFGDQSDAVAERLNNLADKIELQTGVDGNAIQLTQAKLLTFKELANTADELGGNFDRATQAAVDMAAAGFGAAEQNAVQLGKALNDPVNGLAALRRSGITFTEDEKAKIKTLAESNRMHEAQALVLAAIEKQVGGTAEATADASVQIKAAMTQGFEEIGKPLAEALASLTPQFLEFVEMAKPKLAEAGQFLVAIFRSGEAMNLVWTSLKLAFAKSVNFFWAHMRATIAAIGQYLVEYFKTSITYFQILTTPEFWSGMGNAIIGIFLSAISFLQKGLAEVLEMARPLAEIFGKDDALDGIQNTLRESASIIDEDAAARYSKAGDLLEPAAKKIAQRLAELGENVKARYKDAFSNTTDAIDTSGMTSDFSDIVGRIKDAIPAAKEGKKIGMAKVDDQDEPEAIVGSSAALGGFAQSMNTIMGRSANDGMLEESKRQTKLLEAIKSGLAKGGKDVNINVKPVFST